jgi:hypothetical protein
MNVPRSIGWRRFTLCRAASRGLIRHHWPISPRKSLAPYRECLGGNPRRTEQGWGRGTFDRGDLKEAADSTRYGATIDSLSARGIPLCTGLLLDQRIPCPHNRGRRPPRSSRLAAGDWYLLRPEDADPEIGKLAVTLTAPLPLPSCDPLARRWDCRTRTPTELP